jgi:hypothetical protein
MKQYSLVIVSTSNVSNKCFLLLILYLREYMNKKISWGSLIIETIDYADREVKGLERYIPTSLSRRLLIAFATLPVGAFWLVLQYSAQLMPNQNQAEKNLIAIIVALALAIFILFAIIIDLMLVANHSKHRRIMHFSNEHPQMSFRWLKQNATGKHYLFLLLIFVVGILCGQYF